jgi:hypothetical protein
LKFPFRQFAVTLGIVALAGGCFRNQPTSAAFDGCWRDNPPTDYLISTAANVIIGDRGAGADRIRALAGAPLLLDSVRAHSHVVSDPAICSRLWSKLDPVNRTARLAAVQIGRTYWVRLARGSLAFDDSYRQLMIPIVDI